MIGEFIGEILGQVFVEIIFNKIINPFLKIVGSLIRWIIYLGKMPFKDIMTKDSNTRIGFITIIVSAFILMFTFF
tara:strand:+ start:97 stop:321 length:225 start_codon:yes stop_codon:yes gene_type:complete